jgi:hypothetical protein
MNYHAEQSVKWGRVSEALKEATRDMGYRPSQLSISTERRYCPDCECHVQAEWTYDKDFQDWYWQCLECGANLNL